MRLRVPTTARRAPHPAVFAAGTVLIIAVAAVLYLYFWWAGGLVSLLLLPWTLRQPRQADAPRFHVPADLSEARPPQRISSGDVMCSRCHGVVPFASMIVTPDGYFCAACSRIVADARREA